MNTDLNLLRDRAYKCACEHGFHEEGLSNEHFLCLVIGELMEAVEADREGNYCHSKISSTERYTAFPTEESRFKKEFSAFVKDTVEDELADAVIRLLDLAGLRGISLDLVNKDMSDSVDDMAEFCKDETFTESVYAISTLPARYKDIYDFTVAVNDMILTIFGFAKHLDIDLLWHIEQKMKYNELRPIKHGKKY